MFVPSVEATKITIELLNNYKHDESIEEALDLKFQSVSPEEFLENHFAQNNYSQDLQDAVTEFFFRISKIRNYLEVIAKQFFESKNSWARKNQCEFCTYIVFLYLIVIESNEFTKSEIEEILISIDDRKALAILTFFKRKDILKKLYDWGCRIWDVDHVDNLLRNAVAQESIFEEMHQTVADHFRKAKKIQKKEPTIPVAPKCLTRSKKLNDLGGDFIRQPNTRIPICVKSNNRISSNGTWNRVEPAETQKLEKERFKNREEAKNLFDEAQKKAFRCANPEKSDKFKEVVRKIEEERMKMPENRRVAYKKIKYKDVPIPKKTVTVILREGARLLKLEHDEIKRYEDLASGGFNSDLLSEMEEEIREENFRRHIEDIERKHLEGLLSYEESLLAKRKCLRKKKEQTDEFKKEKEIWWKQLEEWKREEQSRLQEAVEREKCLEKAVKEAVEQVKQEKHKIAMETTKESKALCEQRTKEREEDLQRKVQMIKEIKALQALGGIKRKQPNFSETANLGFLCEMSIAELKERLFILRIEVQEELERRRAEVKMKRDCRKEIVETYKELIESHRQITQEKKKLLEIVGEEEEEEKKKKMNQSSPFLDELRRKLYEKRRERFDRQQILQ